MSKHTKHTKGRWRPWFGKDTNGNLTQAGVTAKPEDAEDDDVEVCVTLCEEVSDQVAVKDRAEHDATVEADTMLIAAAPDLLAACRAVLRHPHIQSYLPYDPTDETFLGLVAAIKKAEGSHE